MQKLGEMLAVLARDCASRPILYLAVAAKPLPIALGRAFATARKATDPRLEYLNRIFAAMTPGDQLRTRCELLDCREARRAHILRNVA